MAEGDNPVETGAKGIKGFLSKETAGLPNWVWLIVIAAGLGVAYVIPKFVNRATPAQPNDATAGAGNSSGTVATGPTPNATDMLSAFTNYLNTLTEQGATTLATLQGIQKQLATPPAKPAPKPNPAPNPRPTGPGGGRLPGPVPGPIQPIVRTVTVARWPNNGSTLSQIAAKNGTTVAHLQALNPHISDPNRIQAGQSIRVR